MAHAGSIGGIAEAGCLQPIDTIKTRLQLDKAKQYKGDIPKQHGYLLVSRCASSAYHIA